MTQTAEQMTGNILMANYYGDERETGLWTGVSPYYPDTPKFEYDLEFHQSFDWLCPVARQAREDLHELHVNEKHSMTHREDALAWARAINTAAQRFDIALLFVCVVKAIEFLNEVKK